MRDESSFAFAIFALVLWLRSYFNAQADVSTLLISTFIQWIAMAFSFVPLMTLIMSGLTPDRIPAASGLSNFARITAGAFGTSITTTLWENRAGLHHSLLAESINSASIPANQALSSLSALGMNWSRDCRISTDWSTSRPSCSAPMTSSTRLRPCSWHCAVIWVAWPLSRSSRRGWRPLKAREQIR